jgi:hypothetical protein
MKKALTIFLFFTIYYANAQTKKSQIKILESQLDSFRNAMELLNYRYDSLLENKETAIRHFEEQLSALKNQLATTGKEKDSLSSTNLKLQLEVSSVDLRNKVYKDSLSSLKDSISKMRLATLSLEVFYKWLHTAGGYGTSVKFSNDLDFSSPWSKEVTELGKLARFSDLSYDNYNYPYSQPKIEMWDKITTVSIMSLQYLSGVPGCGFHNCYPEEITLLLFKEKDSFILNNLAYCFNHKKNELLQEINLVAKKQFDEDVKKNGGSFNFNKPPKNPLNFEDLKLTLVDEKVCFSYDVGGGSLVGGGARNSVCLTKDFIKKYLN